MRNQTLNVHLREEQSPRLDHVDDVIWLRAERSRGRIKHFDRHGHPTVRCEMKGQACVHMDIGTLRQLVADGTRILAELDAAADPDQLALVEG